MKRAIKILLVVAALSSNAIAVDIEMVTVGNPGNAGELSGEGAGGYGPDRTCGAVNYQYNIGKYEVTAGQYIGFLNAVAKTDTYGLYNSDMNDNIYGCQITRNGDSGNYTYDFSGRPSGEESDWVDRPVNYVSWYDCLRFSNWLTNGGGSGDTETGAYTITGSSPNWVVNVPDAIQRQSWAAGAKRYVLLPSEDEWYKAAYYNPATSNYFDYPTSSDTTPSNDLVNPDLGNNATFHLTGDYTIGDPYYRTEVGEHEDSYSPYGTFDQGGNIYEWNETVLSESYRVLRGGSFVEDDDNMLAAARSGDDSPTGEYYNIGFRVSEVPEPATLSLLALGGLTMVRRRKLGMCK